MNKIHIVMFSGVLAVLLVVLAGSRNGPEVLRVKDGSEITFKQMIAEISGAKIIVVGEVHDIPEHHRLELNVIKALYAVDKRLVVGLEMFRKDSQRQLDAWSSGNLSREMFLKSYYDNWNEPWPLYRDIFEYSREHRIPMLGLNIPDDISERVARRGFASLTAEQKEKLPPGITCSVDPVYREFIKKAFADHVRPGDKRFLNFCEAQMVWDKTMAWHLVEYLDRHPDDTAVILAGVGHSWKRGIPEQIAALSKYSTVVILPFIPGKIDRDTVDTEDADYVVQNE